MILRPYQLDCVQALWNALAAERNVLCVMSTGSGKTECFIELARRAPVRTAVLVGRDKLVEQTARRMRAVIDDVGVWSAGQGEKRVAEKTVISIHSADKLTIPGLKFLICDEAHNLNDGRYARFLERHPEAKVAGFTATPWRAGAEIFGAGKRFSRIHYRRGLKTLIDEGFLVPPVAKSMPASFDTRGLKTRGDDFILSDLVKITSDIGKITAQVEDAMPRLTERSKIVWMCTSIEHAEKLAKIIPENCSVVHSKNPHNDYAMECFTAGPIRHMVSVMMLSEGWDFPPVDAIVLMRPTKSPTLYVQSVGRGLRPSEGKKNLLVLDYGEVIRNCGPLHDPYTKTIREKTKKEALTIGVRVCKECLSYIFDGTICGDCGHENAEKRDPLKALQSRAMDADIMASRQPEKLECVSVRAVQHMSKSGNNCIKISFTVRGRMWPVSMYISNHSFSWAKGRKIIEGMTPFEFISFKECYDNCEQLVFEAPSAIEVVMENGFETIKRIHRRAPDIDVASAVGSRLLLEEH